MTGGGPGPEAGRKERAIENEKKIATAKSPAEAAGLMPGFAAAQLATAAAWAPDPKNPPLYLDLPTKDGVPVPEVSAKFTANAPLAFIDQYIGNLKQYRAISIDVGDQDGLRIDTAEAARYPRQVWNRQHVRDLLRDTHQRGGGSIPKSCHAFLQQEPVLQSWLPIAIEGEPS